jgi:alanine racemase
VAQRAGLRPLWAEIDLGAVRRNLARLRARAPGRRMIAVVKGGAYGHGAVRVARTLAAAGCEAFGVAMLDEALELRAAGLALPILLLQGLHDPAEADVALDARLWPAVSRPSALEPLAAAARRAGRRFPVHLKIDTGMGRLGMQPSELSGVLDRLKAAPELELSGLMTHLADAEDLASSEAARQRARFADLATLVRERGFRPDWLHVDNSGGVLRGPTPGTTAVRPGIALYGIDPTRQGGLGFEPVMTLRTRVIHAKDVLAGTRIGYGGTFCAPGPTRILTIPVGYADGLPRLASNRYAVGLEGAGRIPLVGRVSMDTATLDAGPDSSADVGDEIVIFGRAGALLVPVEELAAAAETVSYEILSRIGPRVPRVDRA